jgi:hypothetical protein
MIKQFNDIYENAIWGNDNNEIYNGSSGGGSDVDFNIDTYVPFMKTFIEKNNILSVCDLGCGSAKLVEHIFDIFNIKYYGIDCYSKVILHNKIKFSEPKYTFTCFDFFTDIDCIPNVDLIIMKDVLQHWKLNEVISFLEKLITSKKCKYILICNCAHTQTSDRYVDEDGGLSAIFYPLNYFNAKILLTYHTKEVSLITVDNP